MLVHVRMSGMSEPNVSSTEVVAEALRDVGVDPDEAAMMLLPTSPFRSSLDMVNMFTKWRASPDQALISVTGLEQRKVVYWPDNKDIVNFAYLSNGAVQIARAGHVMETYGFWDTPNEFGIYELSGHRGLDIDTELDFALAEAILEKRPFS